MMVEDREMEEKVLALKKVISKTGYMTITDEHL